MHNSLYLLFLSHIHINLVNVSQPGFNTIGSKIVQTTCKIRLKQNLEDISNAYFQWHSSQDSLEIAKTETEPSSTINIDGVNGHLKEEDNNNSIKDSDNRVETSTTEINTAAEAALENNIVKDDDNNISEEGDDNVVESNSESDNNEGERIRKRDILKRKLLGTIKFL